MTAPDDAVYISTPSGRFAVRPSAARGLLERLAAAAQAGEVLIVPLAGASDDEEGVLVVAPATTAVAVTGPRQAFEPPSQGNPVW